MKAEEVIQLIKKETPRMGLIPKVTINPVIAQELLKLNTKNRPLHPLHVKQLAKSMQEERWVFNGGTITFDRDLVLVDGQKRLTAIVESEKAQEFNIQTGLTRAAFAVTDTGQPRQAGDMLALYGYKDVHELARVIRGWIYFRDLQLVTGKVTKAKASNQQVEEFIGGRDIKHMVDCLQVAMADLFPSFKVLSRSNWALLYFILSKIDKNDAFFFMRGLATGNKIDRDSPRTSSIFYARQRLIGIKDAEMAPKMAMDLRFRVILTAWNMYRKKQKAEGGIKLETKEGKLPKPI